MPFRSRAQQRFLYSHPEKVGGKEKLKEWSSATNFSTLPEKKSGWKDAAKRRARERSG